MPTPGLAKYQDLFRQQAGTGKPYSQYTEIYARFRTMTAKFAVVIQKNVTEAGPAGIGY